jgi:hypothetical protein
MKKQLNVILLLGLCCQLINTRRFRFLPIKRKDFTNKRKDFTNNLSILMNTNNFTIKGDLEYAQPFQSGNTYKIIKLYNSSNSWMSNAAASYNPYNYKYLNTCPEGTCSNGIGCLECYPTSKCTLVGNTLTCARLNASFNYSKNVSWSLVNGGVYTLSRDNNGNPILYDKNNNLVNSQ